MNLHKFTCSNDHSFYLALNLPQALEEIGQLLKSLTCPYCQQHETPLFISIHSDVYWLYGPREQRIANIPLEGNESK